jgi:hypothetical protein
MTVLSRKGAVRSAVLLGVLCLGSVVSGRAAAAAASASMSASAVLSVRIGLDDVSFMVGPYPGFGGTLGLRVHERLAIRLDGWMDIYPNFGGWYVTGGVRMSPVLTNHHRLDLDLDLGLGNDDPITMGYYAVDGEIMGLYPILRASGTLLGAVDLRGAMGPRLVLETQPLGKTRIGTLEDGSEVKTSRLVFRGHQVLGGVVWEATAGRPEVAGANRFQWELLAGYGAYGDYSNGAFSLRATFAWVFDRRPFMTRWGAEP